MELELGLSLSSDTTVGGSDLNNNGFKPKEMLGLKLSSLDGCCLLEKKKRSFEDAFGNKLKEAAESLPLLLWSGYPNDEGDDQNKSLSCLLNKNDEVVEEDDDRVVGWPHIKSWRKKLLHHQQQGGGHIVRKRVGGCDGGSTNSMYVKVKMEGVAIARKIDLNLFHSYRTLANSLITMFAKCQQQVGKDSANYTLRYQDKDGDWLVAGDVPWQTFIESVQRLELMRNAD